MSRSSASSSLRKCHWPGYPPARGSLLAIKAAIDRLSPPDALTSSLQMQRPTLTKPAPCHSKPCSRQDERAEGRP
jgi:hypothetical protein